MKIKSNLEWNVGILKAHAPAVQDGKVVIGGGEPKALNIVAGSTIELNDQEWTEDFAVAAQELIDEGALTIVEDVKLSKEDKTKAKKAKIAAAKAALKALEADED
jgi:hypothetical protein